MEAGRIGLIFRAEHSVQRYFGTPWTPESARGIPAAKARTYGESTATEMRRNVGRFHSHNIPVDPQGVPQT